MTRILVTGAAGFIGSRLCEVLLQRGYVVRGLDAFTSFYEPERKQQNIAELLTDPGFELVTADLLDCGLDEVMDGADAVAHLAGEPGVSTSWGPDFGRYVERNVLATQRLLEAACTAGIQRFVYASSSSVYGAATDAHDKHREPRPASPYGVTKLAAETLAGAYAYSQNLDTVSLRYFSVYGPRQRPDMAAHRFTEALLDGRPLTVYGDGRQVRDFTYVDDVVEATIRAIFADVPSGVVLDIASSAPVDVSTLIGRLRELVGAETSCVDRRDERPGDVPRTEGRILAARECLDWSPLTDLRTGLMRQVAWHMSLRGGTQPVDRVGEGDGVALAPSVGGSL